MVAPSRQGSVGGRAAGKTGRAVGHAAVWYRPGDPTTEYRLAPDVVERIARGAFTRTIAEDPIVASYNHDMHTVLGTTYARTLRLAEDSIGLRYDADLPDTQGARDVEELLARGDVRGSSFMFTTRRDEWTKEGAVYVRTLLELDLIELGPVVRPAYVGATAGTGGFPSDAGRDADDGSLAASASRIRTLMIASLDIDDPVERDVVRMRLSRDLARIREQGG
jgi:HK97 family phage prohead protease